MAVWFRTPKTKLLVSLAPAIISCVHSRQEPIVAGTVLSARNDAGQPMTLRVDAVERDLQDRDGEILLYTMSARDPLDGQWRDYCLPDLEGKNRAIPLNGTWNDHGKHQPSDSLITFACSNGVIAKCVRWGYRPWKLRAGISMQVLHQTCTHMARADYCGDGRPHTRDGTKINIYDRFDIQKRDDEPELKFEAAWGPDGAVFLNKTRYGGEGIDAILADCPKLIGRTSKEFPGFDSRAVDAKWPGEALIFNDSAVTTQRP